MNENILQHIEIQSTEKDDEKSVALLINIEDDDQSCFITYTHGTSVAYDIKKNGKWPHTVDLYLNINGEIYGFKPKK